MLFRVFLSDGRVLSSYGEWARLDDRVIFSMPTQLTRDPVELHLVTIPAAARRLAANRAVRRIGARRRLRRDPRRRRLRRVQREVAKVLNDVAKIADPAARLATAERARQKLADWPAAHYGYRIAEVREALGVLDEVIAQLRVAVGITRFDLSLSASAAGPAAAAAVAAADRCGAGRAVRGRRLARRIAGRAHRPAANRDAADRSRGRPAARRVGGAHAPHRQRRARTRAADRAGLRRAAHAHARRGGQAGRARPAPSELERLREKVKEEDRRLGGQRAGDVAALLATIDLQAATAIDDARRRARSWEKRAPGVPPLPPLDQRRVQGVQRRGDGARAGRAMSGPPVNAIGPLAKRLASASRSFAKVNAARRARRRATP